MPKIKVEKDLYEKVRRAAQKSGYSSVEEFVDHVLEREVNRIREDEDDGKVVDQLKGLGYIS